MGKKEEVDRFVKTGNVLGDKWDPELNGDVDDGLWKKYSGELYGVLVSITGGEAKSLVRGIDSGPRIPTGRF